MHDIFISHSGKDAKFVMGLKKDLEDGGLSTWVDDTGLPPGTPDWSIAIEQAIENSECLLVVMTPDSKVTEWVRYEIKYARAQGKKIFSVLSRGSHNTSVPIDLIAVQYVDLREDYNWNKDKLIDDLYKFLKKQKPSYKPTIDDIKYALEVEAKKQKLIDSAKSIKFENIVEELSVLQPQEQRAFRIPNLQKLLTPLVEIKIMSDLNKKTGGKYSVASDADFMDVIFVYRII
jgi:hypothetical protein